MRRLAFVGRVVYIAILFLCLVGAACLGFFDDDDPIAFALTFSGLLALAIAAVCLVAWIMDRRARAAFVASLTDAERFGLRGFEAVRGWGSWRDFSGVGRQRSRVSDYPEC
jgi:hypothetical protein